MATGICLNKAEKVYPLKGCVRMTTSATQSEYLDVSQAHWLTLQVLFGTITGDSVTVTVEKSSTGSGSGTAIPFKYRLSSVQPGTSAWGAVSDATASGVTIAATDDNKVLLIEIDPSALGDYKYVRTVHTPGGSMTQLDMGVIAVVQPRYSG